MDDSARGRSTGPAMVEPSSSRSATTRAMSAANTAQSASPLPSIGEGQEQQPMLVLTPPPRSRKRRASVMTNDEERRSNHPVMRPPGASTSTPQEDYPRAAGSTVYDSNPHNICLCAPDLHIPRPRNAFMLYRQHHQASVIAQNPGITNPEASKIIGRQWKAESPEVLETWNALAETTMLTPTQQEKLRHSQQYPYYKYQPRRNNNRPSPLDGLSTSPGRDWCGKCGGRTMAKTPSTPLTPLTPMRPPMLPPISTAVPVSHGYAHSRPLSAGLQPSNGGNQLHRMSAGSGMDIGRRPSAPTGLGGGLLAFRDSMDDEAMTPLTPVSKRRRMNVMGPPAFDAAVQASRRGSLLSRMDPPPLPVSTSQRPSLSHGTPIDPSLTLPPLQTTEAKSVEAMVMTIPYINKIKVLAKISPSLRQPGPASHVPDVCGVVIAIDGANAAAIAQTTRWLADELSKDSEHVVRTFDVPLDWHPPRLDESTTSGGGISDDKTARFLEYLESVAAWHRRSEEVVRYITSSTGSSPGATREGGPPPSAESTSTNPPASTTTPRTGCPIALIPAYMLTRANLAATHIPINDAYAPLDHWQWAATLWRGIVGADITVWIQDCGGSDEMGGRAANGNGNGNGNGNSGSGSGVEVRDDARALILRKESGKEIEGRVLRRLAFEVSEAVRAIRKGDGDGGA
ncbi:MAG: hypothetical protein M1823_006126 [Watsoniomyces obsoletus]|nr:MAG: hypothetical protein M1823_006126 [Watsoniomyces obsoletus]